MFQHNYNLYSRIASEYDKTLSVYGNSHKGVMWSNEAAQTERFRVLSSLIQNKEVNSINDLGCGFGAFFDYLLRENMLKRETIYYGYDISRQMLKALKQNHDEDPNIKAVLNYELKTEAEYSFVSGTFNLKMNTSKTDWENILKYSILNLDKFSQKGFAFNMLSLKTPRQYPSLYYADQDKVLSFVKENCSGDIKIVNDYLPDDFTVIVVKSS